MCSGLQWVYTLWHIAGVFNERGCVRSVARFAHEINEGYDLEFGLTLRPGQNIIWFHIWELLTGQDIVNEWSSLELA